MSGDDTTVNSAGVGDRFPALKRLEEDVERAKLDQALAEAHVKTLQAKLPSPDVDAARDTPGVSAGSTGLGRVLVQMDTAALADDIADLALDAARAATTSQGNRYSYVIRLVGDRSVFAGVDVHRLLDAQLSRLASRIDAYASSAKTSKPSTKTDVEGHGLLPLADAAGAPGVAVQTLGSATKLLAHVGHEVPVDDLGFDLELARSLTAKERSDETVTVELEGLAPTPGSSRILDRIWGLASITEERLLPVLAHDARALAEAEARAKRARDSIAALNAEILELTKHVKPTTRSPIFLRQRSEQRKDLEESLHEIRAAVVDRRARYELGSRLRKDVEEFLTAALASRPGGARPPALEASRAEDLAAADPREQPRYVLYARLIAGGVDQAIETEGGPDHFRALAGASAEFALLGPGGKLLASGVRSALQSSTMKLDNPRSFHQDRPDYMGLDRVRQE